MPNPEKPESTADYRKYAKGPNFLGIVIGSVILILVLMAVFLYFLRGNSTRIEHIKPNAAPNSQIQPLLPQSRKVVRA